MTIIKKVKNIKWSKVPKPDMSKIINNDLKNTLNDIYRNGATIGNGSTADAIRYTKATGIMVGNSDHIIKGQESIKRLENIIQSGLLGDYDKSIATKIILDIREALNGN